MPDDSNTSAKSSARARCRSVGAALVCCLLLGPGLRVARAQARPSGAGRVWTEVAVGGAYQDQQCRDCARAGRLSGPLLALSTGVTLPRGWGVAAHGRIFQVFDKEYSQGSKYVILLAQYTPPPLGALTVNAGVGWGRHGGDPTPYSNNGSGGVIAAGVALRAPWRSMAGLAVTADLLQALDESGRYHPRLVSVGVGLSLASRIGQQRARE